MKFSIIYILAFVCLSFSAYPQELQGVPFKDRVYMGGGFGAWFSDDFSFVELSPAAGYMITPKLSAGVGITYRYVDRRYYYASGDSFKHSSSSYGGRLFARMNLFGPLFAYGEYESINIQFPYANGFTREWVPGAFLGGGFMQPFGRKGGMGIMILYNFQYDALRSPYNSEWVYRFNFFF